MMTLILVVIGWLCPHEDVYYQMNVNNIGLAFLLTGSRYALITQIKHQ